MNARALPEANGEVLAPYVGDAQVGEMKLWRAPNEVLVEAQQAAIELQKRIAGKKKPVIFGDEQYIENDDWQMVAHFFGMSPKVETTEFVEYGNTTGFKATAVLIDIRTGAVISRGEALCLDEEDNWGDRTKYEWKKDANGRGVRVAVGKVPTPLFQLMSMAQTRACNKAMSNKLKWVVSLAGYSGTPAEDMHAATVQEPKQEENALPDTLQRKPQVSAAPQSQTSQPRPAATVGAGAGVAASAPAPDTRRQEPCAPQSCIISEPQARRFYAIWKGAGKTKEQVTQYLRTVLNISSDREMPADRYKEACAWAERR